MPDKIKKDEKNIKKTSEKQKPVAKVKSTEKNKSTKSKSKALPSDIKPKEKVKGGGKGKSTKTKSNALPLEYIPRLKKRYIEKVTPAMIKEFEYSNRMLLPKLDKIVLNVGMGTLHQDSKMADSILKEMSLMSGQKPVLTKARLSVANFKLRQGMIVGCKVTLRGFRMFEFLDRLISLVIPRIRDFRGLGDKSFDGRGNYTFGVKEQIIFPEIDYDTVIQIHGMDITICTTATTDVEAQSLLKNFGFPFRRPETSQ
ncbi:50S ribosomal protein L5 [bacterium]|nr:50S ribosomal protein L5 [bacterium]